MRLSLHFLCLVLPLQVAAGSAIAQGQTSFTPQSIPAGEPQPIATAPVVNEARYYNNTYLRGDTVPWTYSLALMPLSFLASGLEVAYEARVPRTYSTVRINAGGFLGEDPWFYDSRGSYSGYRLEFQYRYHFLDFAYERRGYYMGPYAQFKSIDLVRQSGGDFFDPFSREERQLARAIGLGVIGGYQMRSRNGFVIDMYIGGGLVAPVGGKDQELLHLPIVNPYERGISAHAGLGLGFMPRKRARPTQ